MYDLPFLYITNIATTATTITTTNTTTPTPPSEYLLLYLSNCHNNISKCPICYMTISIVAVYVFFSLRLPKYSYTSTITMLLTVLLFINKIITVARKNSTMFNYVIILSNDLTYLPNRQTEQAFLEPLFTYHS